MKSLLLTIAMSMLTVFMAAGITQHYQMNTPVIQEGALGTIVKLDGAKNIGKPGEPDLPYFGFSLLLPEANEAISITVRRDGPVIYSLKDIVAPVQRQYPFSHTIIEKTDKPNPQIYNSDDVYPQNPERGFGTEFMNGHPIAFGSFSPFEYYPQQNELVFYKSAVVEIEYQPSTRAREATRLLKKDAFVSQRLMQCVDNHYAVPSYRSDRTVGIEYLMIVDEAKVSNWEPLENLYTNQGLSVYMKPISEIAASQAGSDLQEKIRNYIISVYESNPLRFVLLGGDTDLIPHRGFIVDMGTGSERDSDIPADMYYSSLDGNWNTDNDQYWGEVMEADLAPELAIGRICYNNDIEIANQINKITLYQILPVEEQVTSAAFVGEWLWDGPTWGGDYMDEMIGGSSSHGYTTVGVPTSWDISTLYDRTYGYSDAWGSTEIKPFLSEGATLVNHLGHSNTTYNMRLSNNLVSDTEITNNGQTENYSIYFTQGCYAGSFDNRETTAGQYTADCISEKFTSIATAAAGMISHSRYGWGMQGSTDGASQYFHREYIDAIFGENIHNLGYTLVDSKIDNIPFIYDNLVMYWVTYETNLFGCPVTRVWSDSPQTMSVNLPVSWMVGLNSYQIVTNAPNSFIRIKHGEEVVYEGESSEFGVFNIVLEENLVPGNYQIYITAPNFYPYDYTVYVTANNMPYIVCWNVSNSDEDGLIHTGDILGISATIKNMGLIDQQNPGVITLNSPSSNIEILQGTYAFESISAGDSLIVDDAFQSRVMGSFADNSQATLVFNASFDGYETESFHNLRLAAPVLSLGSYSVTGSNLYVMPGDTASISFTLNNTGTGNALTPFILVFTEDPQLTTDVFELVLDPVPGGGTTSYNQVFDVHVADTAEIGSSLSLSYVIAAENGNAIDGRFQVSIGLINYGFEADQQNWESVQLQQGFTNQWHRSSQRNNTPDGSWSMKFGNQDLSSYTSSGYGALISPELAVNPGSVLKFWHWMDAEDHDDYPSQAWDGGLVEMSLNGGGWSSIEPVGGYPKTIYNNPASPFDSGTPVYSGSFSWEEAIFELGNITGVAQFRFVFGSDGYVAGEGWYIDDVRVESTSDSDEAIAAPVQISLKQNYPNPFNPNTNISFYTPKSAKVRLSIYNLKGQLVTDLVNSEVPAGENVFTWDGRDKNGHPVASGIYSYRLKCESITQTKKMILMK
ncbi:MAG: C25 family cysteine peptidase [Candidatus Cloacimonetes bacterium]|nr:C25 family cysteine peptidase [Candidatus Cloacimonadota bacterium]